MKPPAEIDGRWALADGDLAVIEGTELVYLSDCAKGSVQMDGDAIILTQPENEGTFSGVLQKDIIAWDDGDQWIRITSSHGDNTNIAVSRSRGFKMYERHWTKDGQEGSNAIIRDLN
eukprot:GEMP01121788.1.p1 GENE.GEMP01121788.1~~GEMP01121788.1.p1  ORF type:complete len:137 (+),score=14.64 GEMP01121788.1:63-413(+)